jgi:hypothetical protein
MFVRCPRCEKKTDHEVVPVHGVSKRGTVLKSVPYIGSWVRCRICEYLHLFVEEIKQSGS